jgi:Domain of unknown function (DUF4126)
MPSVALAILLGVGLAASAGLNAFVPLLFLSAAAHFHLAGIALNQHFGWLSSDTALAVLLVATLVELIVDKFPTADHALHAIGMVIRPVAGALAAYSVFTKADPVIAGVVAIMIAAPTSLAVNSVKAGTRLASTVSTMGCANPILSLIEDAISLAVAAVAIFAPLLVPVVLAMLVVALVMIARRLRPATPAAARSAR